MATVAQPSESIYKGQNVIGVHEMVNGRLQFRTPLGALSDDDRKRIQANLPGGQIQWWRRHQSLQLPGQQMGDSGEKVVADRSLRLA